MLGKKTKIRVSNYDLEPKSPLLKEIKYIIITLAVLLFIGGFAYYSRPSAKEEAPKKEVNFVEEKNRIINRVNIANLGDKPLTTEENNEIYNKISGSKAQDFNFTDEEKLKLLKALNYKK